MKGPILKGKRIILRPIAFEDAPVFVSWFKDPEVVQYMSPKIYKINLAEEKKYIKKVLKEKNELVYAILNKQKKLVGSVAIHLDSRMSNNAGFGIVIGDKTEWGKGYAGECINLLTDLVFKKLKINRLQLTVFVENKRAFKAYKKAGFKLEGRLREQVLSRVDGKYHDEYIMSILRSEWLKKYKK